MLTQIVTPPNELDRLKLACPLELLRSEEGKFLETTAKIFTNSELVFSELIGWGL